MRFHTLVSASFIMLPATPLYLASIAALSNSGSVSSHTFMTSTVTDGRASVYAVTKASVRAIECDLEARGDASILSRWMGRLAVAKDASSFKKAPRRGCRGNWVTGFIGLSLR